MRNPDRLDDPVDDSKADYMGDGSEDNRWCEDPTPEEEDVD